LEALDDLGYLPVTLWLMLLLWLQAWATFLLLMADITFVVGILGWSRLPGR